MRYRLSSVLLLCYLQAVDIITPVEEKHGDNVQKSYRNYGVLTEVRSSDVFSGTCKGILKDNFDHIC